VLSERIGVKTQRAAVCPAGSWSGRRQRTVNIHVNQAVFDIVFVVLIVPVFLIATLL